MSARRATIEPKQSWKQTAALIFSILIATFGAAVKYGADTQAVKNELAEHGRMLANNSESNTKLQHAVEAQTDATKTSTTEQTAQRAWLIRIIQVLTESRSEEEKRRRLREIANEMRKSISENLRTDSLRAGGSGGLR